MRDSQQGKCYAWERKLFGEAQWRQTMTIEEVVAYVKALWRKERGRVGLAKLDMPIVVARRGSSAASFGGRLEFGTHCRNRIVALHEMAHELNRGDRVGGHGPRFVGILIGLYARHLDLDANDLMAQADEMGVKYHVRSIGSVPVFGKARLVEQAVRKEGPMTEMDIACWLDMSYLQVRGAAMSLITKGKARWLRGKLVLTVKPEPVVETKPKAPRKPGTSLKALAADYGIDIEKQGRWSGWMVYPPDTFSEERDPYEGDHFCDTWAEVREMVKRYVALMQPVNTDGDQT